MMNGSMTSCITDPQFVIECHQNDQNLVTLLIEEIRNTVKNPISLLQTEVSEL